MQKKKIEDKSKIDKMFYRNLAYSYFCAAKALWQVFGEDKNVPGIIKLIVNPTSKDEIRHDILLLPHPFVYLLQHSLELYMKGFLLQKGEDEKTFKEKKLGHNMINLMNKCKDYGFEFIHEEEEYIIKSFHKLNSEVQSMRYPESKKFHIPNFHGISKLLNKFDQELLRSGALKLE